MPNTTDLTKQDLLVMNVTDITEEGKIYIKGRELTAIRFTSNRLTEKAYFTAYDVRQVERRYSEGLIPSATRTIQVERAIWAWFHGVCPAGYSVVHLDGDTRNFAIWNLMLMEEVAARRYVKSHVQ